MECPARRYTAFLTNKEAHVFHVGTHTCKAREVNQRAEDIVRESLLRDPKMTPSTIQVNAILGEIRARKDWTSVLGVVSQVSNKKAVSNEKVKRQKELHQFGFEYEALKEFKGYLDTKDPLLLYDINGSEHHVFKTSRLKMKLAYSMSHDPIFNEEYCFFDGKENRTKYFTTLTASMIYHFLQEQMPLAIVECKSEDSVNFCKFWRLFNKA